ncbi:BF3164 family lipoprotein [Phocaeicola sp.]|uniref:BF3164 family lipoprotein n=1 Tax=Phocaeicola sp. TaxID=2773926 RepID=UPI0023D592A8|nr:BF3164 family lipoprotein [Phocaeicola sp.]MDE5678064.1 TolB-like 6-bladed beta-propeller domain-containing protein [Phocaeicola sp.]
MRKIFLCLLFCLCLFACKNRVEGEVTVPEVYLDGKELLVDSFYMGKYLMLLTGDGELVMPSYLRDSVMYVGKLKGDSVITADGFLACGMGPNEISSSFSVSECCSDSVFTFLDWNGGRLNFVYNIPVAEKKRKNKTLWKRYTFERVVKYRCAVPALVLLSDTTLLLGAGAYCEPYVLSVVNLNTQEITPVDFWPDGDGVECPNLTRQAVYMNNARLYKNGNQILYSCGMGHYAFIFELDGSKMVHKKVLFDVYPEYKVNADGMNYDYTSSWFSELKFFTTQKFIYVMVLKYDRVKKKPYKEYPYYYNDEILVFDWEGNKVKKYVLDIPFNFFVIDEKDERMYTETVVLNTGEDLLRSYRLE